jgi:hypothetical protein
VSGFTAVKSYSYDALNRLKQATESITPNGGTSSQSWRHFPAKKFCDSI